MRKMLKVVFALALVFGLAAAATAAENPAAWEGAASYLENLPQGFNGIRGDALKAKLDSGENLFLLDVREPNEFAGGHIEGAMNVPVRGVPKALDKLPQDKSAQIVVVCASAVRSGYVAQALSFKGYTNVKHLAAGYVAGWEKAGYPVKK
jgi:rhodanese-related sulfurtransferase